MANGGACKRLRSGLDWPASPRSLLGNSQRFSKPHFRALNDLYNLAYRYKLDDPWLLNLFQSRWIRQINMTDVTDAPLTKVHTALKDYLIGLDFQPDGFDGVKGSQRLRIRSDAMDGENSVIAQLERAVRHVGKKYIEFLKKSNYPKEYITDNLDITKYVMATKSGGYHFPHLHNNVVFVVAYYVYVPENNDGKIVFGLN
jgi:hypothetical protein